MKIIVPQTVVDQVHVIANNARKAFQRKLKKPKFVGFINMPKARSIGVIVQEIDDDRNPEVAKKSVAAYNHILDCIYVYRASLQSKFGPISVEHYLMHEVAHAVDRERVIKESKNSRKLAASGQRFIDKYACQQVEFDAEMAAIEYIDMPFIRNNYSMLVATYLNTTSGYLGCWTRNKKMAKEFIERLERILDAEA